MTEKSTYVWQHGFELFITSDSDSVSHLVFILKNDEKTKEGLQTYKQYSVANIQQLRWPCEIHWSPFFNPPVKNE